MAEFPSAVDAPRALSYGAPAVDFSAFAGLVDDYNRAGLQQQQKKLNDQRLTQGQTAIDLSKAFQGGIPKDAQGNPDYKAMIGILAQKGGIEDIWQLAPLAAQQQQQGISLYGDGTPAPAGGGSAQPSGPSSVAARTLPAPAANFPQGDAGSGTIASIVTDRLPNQDTTTGQTIGKIAQVMGVEPNANLTEGQQKRVQKLLDRYAPKPQADAAPGNLPPSAGAGTPAPTPQSRLEGSFSAVQPAPAPQGGAPVQPGPAPVAPQAGQPAQPQPFGLPPTNPFNGKQIGSPQEAANVIRAIEGRADQLRRQGVPEARIKQLTEDAERIRAAFTPIEARPGVTMITPATGQTVFSNQSRLSGEAINAAAERYLQTGQFPPNMGRGVQGDATRNQIMEQAHSLAVERGIDEATLPQRWQQFATTAAGRRVLENRAAGLTLAENEASSLIPRVREASAKISRTNYPTLNSVILAAQKGTGGTDVIKFGLAVSSLIPVYARVLKPTGQVTEGDLHRAGDILDKAWSDGQIGAALDQMQVELKSARQALDKSLKEFGTTSGETPGSGGSTGGGSSSQPSFKPPGDWQYSPSRGQYRDPSGAVYDLNGNKVQ